MSGIRVDTRASKMWDRMYTQKPGVSQELKLYLNNFQQHVGKAKEVALTLPGRFSSEMGNHLQTLLNLLFQYNAADAEKQVSGALLEKFGAPQFTQAVPTFNLLTNYLLNSEHTTGIVAQETTRIVQEIKAFLYKTSIFMHEEKIRMLEKKIKLEEEAGRKFSAEAQSDERQGIRSSIALARKKFKKTANNYRAEIRKLRSQQNDWMILVNQMSRSSALAQTTAGKKYEVNPLMAVA